MIAVAVMVVVAGVRGTALVLLVLVIMVVMVAVGLYRCVTGSLMFYRRSATSWLSALPTLPTWPARPCPSPFRGTGWWWWLETTAAAWQVRRQHRFSTQFYTNFSLFFCPLIVTFNVEERQLIPVPFVLGNSV